MILDEAIHKSVEEFIRSYSIDEKLTENAAIHVKHCCKEKIPAEDRKTSLIYE